MVRRNMDRAVTASVVSRPAPPVVVRAVSPSSAPRPSFGASGPLAASVARPRPSRATQHLRDSKPVNRSQIERKLTPTRGAVLSVSRPVSSRTKSLPAVARPRLASSMLSAPIASRALGEKRVISKASSVTPAVNPTPAPLRSSLPLHAAATKTAHSSPPLSRKDQPSVCKERPRSPSPSVGRAGRSRAFIPWCS